MRAGELPCYAWKPPSPPMAIFSGFAFCAARSSSLSGTCGTQNNEVVYTCLQE